MLGFLAFWLINSTIVAVVAGFSSGDMTPGQWVIALAGGLVLNFVEARLFALLFGQRTPVFHPVTGDFIGSYRSTEGLLSTATNATRAREPASASNDLREYAPISQAGRPSADAAVSGNEKAVPPGPWSAKNAERDAGLLLRAVLYALLSEEAPAAAKAYATAISRTVVEGNEKTLLVMLSAVTYFVGKVHFLRDNPFDDPEYAPYSSLLAAHFMNAAMHALPGPNPPSDKARRAKANRLAADTSQASMALVEALEAVGSSALDSVA